MGETRRMSDRIAATARLDTDPPSTFAGLQSNDLARPSLLPFVVCFQSAQKRGRSSDPCNGNQPLGQAGPKIWVVLEIVAAILENQRNGASESVNGASTGPVWSGEPASDYRACVASRLPISLKQEWPRLPAAISRHYPSAPRLTPPPACAADQAHRNRGPRRFGDRRIQAPGAGSRRSRANERPPCFMAVDTLSNVALGLLQSAPHSF